MTAMRTGNGRIGNEIGLHVVFQAAKSAKDEGQHRWVIQNRHNEKGVEPVVGWFDRIDD